MYDYAWVYFQKAVIFSSSQFLHALESPCVCRCLRVLQNYTKVF